MRFVLALVAALLVALVPAADAAPKKRSTKQARVEIVCFKKTVKAKSGRKVRKKVCRPRRKAATARKPVKKSPQIAAPATPGIPTSGEGPAPSPVLGSPVVVPAGPAAPSPAVPACVPEDSEWLTATALDVNQKFVLRLTRTCLRAGRTIVQYDNQDAQEHDLWVEGTSPAVTKRQVFTRVPGETREQADMNLAAGEWRLFCSINGHGTMSRTVTVVG